MVPSILILFVIILIFAWIYFRIKHRQMYKLAAKFNGPPVLPIIGNLHYLIGKQSEDMFHLIQQICSEYITPVRIWIGPMLLIYLTKPMDIQKVLNSNNCLDKMYIYKMFGWESGVLSTKAEIWKTHRKLLNPCFSPSILQNFLNIFKTKSQVLVKCLQKQLDECPKDEFDIFPFFSAFTLDTICTTILDFDVDSQNSNNQHFVSALEELFPIINKRIFNVLLHPDFIYKYISLSKEERKLRKIISDLTDKIIKEKVANSKYLNEMKRKDVRQKAIYDEPELASVRCEKNLVDELLKITDDFEQETYTDDLLREEIEGIIVVGNETTALTASFVVLMLAIHSDVQQTVYNEISTVCSNTDLTYMEKLNEMHYLEMVIKETLRLFPPGPLIVRRCTENVDLQHVTAPKGAYLIINIYGLHRDTKIWGEDVDQFNPDRFSSSNIKFRHPYSFVPFSGGKRICLGYKYSMLSMKTMLTELIQKYRFSSSLTMNDLVTDMNITLKLKNKHLVKIDRRCN